MKRKIFLLLISILSVSISHAQNVGIGTNSPSEKLQVSGNIKTDTVKTNGIKITPNAGAGKLLTSDANGNASWQTSNIGGGVGFGAWGDCATNGNISEYNPVTDSAGANSDYFGGTVSISGNYAIVSSSGDDVSGNTDQGSVSILQYDGSNWVSMQKITDATGAAGDRFGTGVAISGNYAIVGSPYADVGANSNQGSASIYQYNGSSWVFMQKLTGSGGSANDYFGLSVSISGNYAIVGAYMDDIGANSDQGSASIYQYNGSSWVLMQIITDATGAAGDEFGTSVSISGNYAIVSAFLDDVGANTNQGSASIYQYNGSNWILMQKITDPSGAASDFFGYNVSISGNYAIIGVPFDDISGNNSQGSASIYKYNGVAWILMQQLTDATGAANDQLGTYVSLSGNYAIVGSPNHTVGANAAQGSAITYIRVGNGWSKLQYVTDPLGNASDTFGGSVSIDGVTKRFAVGANNYASFSGKVVFGKIN